MPASRTCGTAGGADRRERQGRAVRADTTGIRLVLYAIDGLAKVLTGDEAYDHAVGSPYGRDAAKWRDGGKRSPSAGSAKQLFASGWENRRQWQQPAAVLRLFRKLWPGSCTTRAIETLTRPRRTQSEWTSSDARTYLSLY